MDLIVLFMSKWGFYSQILILAGQLALDSQKLHLCKSFYYVYMYVQATKMYLEKNDLPYTVILVDFCSSCAVYEYTD